MRKKQGYIDKVLNYYFALEHSSFWGNEIDRAMKEFFEERQGPDSKYDFGHFSEWFIFVFKLQNGETPFSHFCKENPFSLDSEELNMYKEQSKENEYGVFEITAIRHGKGLTLYNLLTKKTYEVAEVIATRQVVRRNTLFCRIARRSGVYEIIGGSTIYISAPAREVLPLLDEFTKPLDPKEIFLNMKMKEELEEKAEKELPSISKLDLSHAGIEIMPLSGGKIEIIGSYEGPTNEEYDGCYVCNVLVSAREQGKPPDPEKLREAIEKLAFEQHKNKK